VPVAKWPLPVKSAGSGSSLVYEFLGWYNGTTAYVQTYQFSTDMTLTAKYADTPSLPDVTYSILPAGIIQLQKDTVPEGGMPMIVVTASAPGNATITYTWYVQETLVTDPESELTTQFLKSGANATDTMYTIPEALLEEDGVYYYYIKMHYDAENKQKATYAGPITVVVRGDYVFDDETMERISIRNASIPLYKFTLPDGASWDDYTAVSIDYYITEDKLASAARTRLYGPFVEADFVAYEGGTLNGSYAGSNITKWYGLGENTKAGEWRVDANEVAAGVSRNNSFILDGRTGRVDELVADTWVTMEYPIDGSQKDNAMPAGYLPKNRAETSIYLGPYLLGGGGDTATQYYARHVVLLNELSGDLNIEAEIVQYWAVNNADTGVGVWRRVVSDVPEAAFVCDCDDSDPLTHVCNCEAEVGKCTKAMCGDCTICFEPCIGCTFESCYCEGECDCAECAAELPNKIAALKALNGITKVRGPGAAPDTQTPLDGGVASILKDDWNDVYYFTFEDAGLTDLDFTETIEVHYQLVKHPGSTAIAKMVVKAGAGVTTPDVLITGAANSQYVDLASASEKTKTGKVTIDLTKWPTVMSSTDPTAPPRDGISFQNNPGKTKYYITIISANIKPAVDPGAALGAVTFGTLDTVVTAKAGTISYVTDGYEWVRGGGYNGDFAWFTVNFGDGYSLTDYEKVKLTINVSADAQQKRVYMIAGTNLTTTLTNGLAAEADVGALSVTPDGSNYGPYYNDALTNKDIELTIGGARAATFDGEQELEVGFYLHNNNSTITITNVEFVLRS
jgi:hypothetical protein